MEAEPFRISTRSRLKVSRSISGASRRPSTKMSPAWPSEKPRRRMSSSPVSPAWNVTPAVVRSTSRKSSRLRSSSRRSVITVTDCGMSRSAWVPLPIRVSVALSVVFESVPMAWSRTSIVPSVVAGVAAGDWAKAGEAVSEQRGAERQWLEVVLRHGVAARGGHMAGCSALRAGGWLGTRQFITNANHSYSIGKTSVSVEGMSLVPRARLEGCREVDCCNAAARFQR